MGNLSGSVVLATLFLGAGAGAVACSSSSADPAVTDPKTDASTDDDDDGASDAGAKGDGSTPDPRGDAGADSGEPLDCFDFSDDPDVPLAIDGTFTTETERWRRPHDDPPVCPATDLLPPQAAEVPRVVYAFCNNDTVEHTYTFEMLGTDGPSGQSALDDPYLFLYSGRGIPSDAKQCLAVNDDIPGVLTSDSEIAEVTVPPGGAITVVGTTVTFDPTDGTGQGYYILVVSNVDDE